MQWICKKCAKTIDTERRHRCKAKKIKGKKDHK